MSQTRKYPLVGCRARQHGACKIAKFLDGDAEMMFMKMHHTAVSVQNI